MKGFKKTCWIFALERDIIYLKFEMTIYPEVNLKVNFQMFNLDIEQPEEAEIKLPTSVGSLKKQENSRKKKHLLLLYDYAKAFDCVDRNKLWKLLKEMGIPDHLTCSWEICMHVRKQHLELDMEQQTGSK